MNSFFFLSIFTARFTQISALPLNSIQTRPNPISGFLKAFALIVLVYSSFFFTTAHTQNKVVVHHSWWAPNELPADGSYNWTGITHLIAFGHGMRSTAPYLNYRTPGQWTFDVIADAHANNVKVLMSIIGDDAGFQPWIDNTVDSTRCQTVVDTIWTRFVSYYGYDGVDIDWEGGTIVGRADKWMMISRMFRRKLDSMTPPGLLFADIERDVNSNQPVWFINQYYDNVQPMLYDVNGWYTEQSGFHNALYNPVQDYPTITQGNMCADSCMVRFERAGIIKSKVTLGVALYPHVFHGYVPAVYQPGQEIYQVHRPQGAVCGLNPPWCEGLENWSTAVYPKLLAGATEHYAPHAAMAWIGSQSSNYYLNYNNAATYAAYCTYIRDNSWGGIMLFAQEQQYMNPMVAWPIGSGNMTHTPLMDDFRRALVPQSPSAPSFLVHPANSTVFAGGQASFAVTALGYPMPTFQWQRNGVNIPGASGGSYVLPVALMTENGATFRCVATNPHGVATSSSATLTVSAPVVANPVSDDFSNTARFTNLWTKSHPQLTSLVGLGTSDAFLRLNLDGTTAHEMGNNDYSAVRVLQDITDGNFEVVAKFQTLPSATYQWEGVLVKENASSFLRFDIIKDNGGLKFYAGKVSASSEQRILTSANIAGPSAWVKVGRVGSVWTASYSADGSTFIQAGQFVQVMAVDSIGVYAGNQTGGSGVPAFDCKVDYFFNVSSPINPEDPVAGAPTGTFTASSDTLPAGGGNVTLTWTSSGAVSASIDQGIGSVALNGSATVPVGQTMSFTLTLTNALGTQSYIAGVFVALPGGGGNLQDITSTGNPVALITNPTGTGNRNLEIIRDGITPPQGSSNPNDQYDTYNGGGIRLVDWIGYTYSAIQSFGSIILQEGIHASEGGFFAGSPRVEVRVGAQWIEVQGLVITPAYSAGSVSNFAMYTLSFNAISGDGIRVAGTPGGTARYLSVAELRVMGTATSTVPPDNRPKDFDLLRNYPNPFNPSTTIEFWVPATSHVALSVYNILGQKVRTLVDQAMEHGKWPVTWDGRDDQNHLMSSGVYVYRMQAGDFVATRKMILSK